MESNPITSDRRGIIDHGRQMGEYRFEHKMDINPNMYGRIIGAQGKTKRQLEQETKSQILVPSRNSRSTMVTIKGNTEEDVMAAMERLKQFTVRNRVRSYIPKQKFTHFLGISFATDEIKKNFYLFSDDIRRSPETSHLHESMIQQPEKLHITLSMLALNGEDKSEAIAMDCLRKCKSSIIDPILQDQSLVLEAAGVEIFSDCKPTAVNVVFAKIESEALQKIANQIARFLESEGLVRQERETIALHMTLLNTYLYTGSEDGGTTDEDRCRMIKKKPFDATSILERYKNFHFGSLTVKEIHLSRLGTRTPDGYYESAGLLEIISSAI